VGCSNGNEGGSLEKKTHLAKRRRRQRQTGRLKLCMIMINCHRKRKNDHHRWIIFCNSGTSKYRCFIPYFCGARRKRSFSHCCVSPRQLVLIYGMQHPQQPNFLRGTSSLRHIGMFAVQLSRTGHFFVADACGMMLAARRMSEKKNFMFDAATWCLSFCLFSV